MTNAALDAYSNGPNWIANESIPIGYYRSCGSSYWYDALASTVDWSNDNGSWTWETSKHCSALFYIENQWWNYKCYAYSLRYGSKRGLGEESFAAFTRLTTHFQLVFAILGTVNLIIMTRVIKQMGEDRSDTLVLHQAEIVCDILLVTEAQISFPDVANAMKHAITGKLDELSAQSTVSIATDTYASDAVCGLGSFLRSIL